MALIITNFTKNQKEFHVIKPLPMDKNAISVGKIGNCQSHPYLMRSLTIWILENSRLRVKTNINPKDTHECFEHNL